jgi:cyclic beta-1,2-glucan synthetase
VRGDWQLLPWILGFAKPRAGQAPRDDTFPRIGRWKMIDNLRLALSAPFGVAALVYGWTLPIAPALNWTLFVLAAIALPIGIPLIFSSLVRRPGVSVSNHLRALATDAKLAGQLFVFSVGFLADQACLMTDAIARTLWRLFVSRRHLLEWTPAAQATADKRLSLAAFFHRMSGALGVAAAALFIAVLFGSGAWVLAAPFVALWAPSPVLARLVSLKPGLEGGPAISNADRQSLRQTARLTWRYFETFVTAQDNMLPPDIYQEEPPALAHRTSPTNIGLYLLSVASARDFGWISLTQAIGHLEATLTTMQRMARFRGHFYNWYDTRDLRALEPKYISSVDSGNLAGHLIALASACRDWRSSPIGAAARLAGVADMLALTSQSAKRLRFGRATRTVTPGQLEDSLAALTEVVQRRRRQRRISPKRRVKQKIWSISRRRSGPNAETKPAPTFFSGRNRHSPRSPLTART